MHFSTKKMVTLALLSAMAYVVMVFFRIPLMAAAPFLKYDPKDIIIVIGGFLYGPLAALLMSVTVSLVEMFTVSESGVFGMLMNVISTSSFACTAALVYKYKKDFFGAVLGLIAGCIVMAPVMLAWNWLIVPLYSTTPRDKVVGMLIPVFLPFNLIKGGINAAGAALLYKPVKLLFFKARLD